VTVGRLLLLPATEQVADGQEPERPGDINGDPVPAYPLPQVADLLRADALLDADAAGVHGRRIDGHAVDALDLMDLAQDPGVARQGGGEGAQEAGAQAAVPRPVADG